MRRAGAGRTEWADGEGKGLRATGRARRGAGGAGRRGTGGQKGGFAHTRRLTHAALWTRNAQQTATRTHLGGGTQALWHSKWGACFCQGGRPDDHETTDGGRGTMMTGDWKDAADAVDAGTKSHAAAGQPALAPETSTGKGAGEDGSRRTRAEVPSVPAGATFIPLVWPLSSGLVARPSTRVCVCACACCARVLPFGGASVPKWQQTQARQPRRPQPVSQKETGRPLCNTRGRPCARAPAPGIGQGSRAGQGS